MPKPTSTVAGRLLPASGRAVVADLDTLTAQIPPGALI